MSTGEDLSEPNPPGPSSPSSLGLVDRPVPSGESDFVVVANRLPVDKVRLPDGSTTWKRSPGGLVTALEPLLRKRRGAWIGWPGIVAEDDADPEDTEPIVADDEMLLYPVQLSARSGRPRESS